MKQYYENELGMLCQKGFYPYEWVDNVEKLNFIGLPPAENFYSTLSQESISAKNYEHATAVYNKLNCKSFKDYHMTYLKCEVLLLADVLKTTLEEHVLIIISLTPLIIFLPLVLHGMLC